MGSRERKRAERRKRKRRSAARQSPAADSSPKHRMEATEDGNGTDPLIAAPSRSELKDAEARAALTSLEEGERPLVVTIAAVISTVVTAASVLGYLLWDVLRDDPRPEAVQVAAFTLIAGMMSYGLWRVRYWAVLGFQAALLLVILLAAVGAVGSLTVGVALGNLALLAAAGALFFFMVKALARIQMPDRMPRD